MPRSGPKSWAPPSVDELKTLATVNYTDEHLEKNVVEHLGSFSAETHREIKARLKDIFDIAYISEREFAKRPNFSSQHFVLKKAQTLLHKLQQDVFDHLEHDNDTKRLIIVESEAQYDPSDPYGSRFEASHRAIDDLLKWVESAIRKTPKKSAPGRDGHAEHSAVFELLKLWANVHGRLPTKSEALSFATAALQPMLPCRAKGGTASLAGHVKRALKELDEIWYLDCSYLSLLCRESGCE